MRDATTPTWARVPTRPRRSPDSRVRRFYPEGKRAIGRRLLVLLAGMILAALLTAGPAAAAPAPDPATQPHTAQPATQQPAVFADFDGDSIPPMEPHLSGELVVLAIVFGGAFLISRVVRRVASLPARGFWDEM